MEYIKVIRNKEELYATSFFEFQLGKFKGKYWAKESLYIDEDPFTLILKILEKSISNIDFYGITIINKDNWRETINVLKNSLPKISQAKNITDLKKIIYLKKYYEDLFLEKFNVMKKLTCKLIESVIIWLEENIIKHQFFTIIGL